MLLKNTSSFGGIVGEKLGFFVFLHELAYLATFEIIFQILKICF